VKIEPQLNLEAISGLTAGFSGADLANLVNEAALIATREDAKEVNLLHFTLALERIVAGLEKKKRLLNPREKKMVAVHEMGHAIVGHAFSLEEKIHKVSIIPHGIGSMGHTIQRPLEDRFIMTKTEIKNKIIVLMAGRAAESLIFQHLSTGAADDLLKATHMARDMVTKFGMEQELGHVAYDDAPSSFLDLPSTYHQSFYSDQTAREIDEAIKKIIWHAYHEAYLYLKEHKTILEESSQRLIEKETLTGDELESILQLAESIRVDSIEHTARA
jgi:cell division protease FtsH